METCEIYEHNQPQSQQARELGVGLLPSRVIERCHPGHMWLYWGEPSNTEFEFRGYYPDLDKIPSDIDLSGWKNFFYKNSVPGLIRRDYYAMQWTEQYSDDCLDKCWSVDRNQLSRLKVRCRIPEGRDSIESGCYSWNECREDWDNCSSWVLKEVNYAMDTLFLLCSRPKKLGCVINEIWGSDVKA